MSMPVFRDVAIANAKKQAELVDALTEDAPIIANLPMQASSHPFTNVYERVITMDGAEVVKVDDALPSLTTDTELKQTDLSVIGGIIEVGEDKAAAMGGRDAYFAKQTPMHMRYAGQNMENSVIYDLVRKAIIDNSKSTNIGGSSNTNYSVLCVKWTSGENIGLYSESQFGRGAVFDIQALNNGGVYKDSSGRLVYGIRLKNYFGVQLANTKNYAGLVNIDIDSATKKVPNAAQVERMIADAHGSEMNTVLYMHPNVFAYVFSDFKATNTQYTANEQNIRQTYRMFAGIPVITSYNFLAGTEANV